MYREQTLVRQIPWRQLALTLGLGGMIFSYLLLWQTQGLIQLFRGGRLVTGGEGLLALSIAVLIISAIGLFILAKFLRFKLGQAIVILTTWLVMYVIVWLIGIAMAGMSLPIYLICWVLFGVAGGYLIGEREMAPAQPAVAHQPATLIHSSEFGRIPRASVVLLTKHVRSATGPIISVLPERTPEELRSFTVHAVLDRMLRDWWENGNKDGLTSQDIDDLKSFVAMAVAMAAQPTGDPAHKDELSQAIYRATLSALLDDWLLYWNADGVDGPPRR